MAVEIDDDILVPGDIIRLDFEILTEQEQLRAWAIRRVKEEVWSHPKLDYHSSQTIVMGDVARQRDVTILQIWAKVRTHDKATREQIQYASLVEAVKVIGLAIVAIGAYVVLTRGIKSLGETIEQFGRSMTEGARDAGYAAGLLVIALAVSVLIFAE
jgi:hypothetical protein